MAKQDETKTLQDKNWCLGVKWEFTFCRVESLFLQQEIYSSPCCSPSAPPLFRRPVGFWHGEAGGGQWVKEGALSLRFCCTLGARESKIKEWACHDSKPPARCTACSSFPVLYWSSFTAHRVWQCWAWLWASQQIPCCNPLDYRRKPSLHLRTIRLAQIGIERSRSLADRGKSHQVIYCLGEKNLGEIGAFLLSFWAKMQPALEISWSLVLMCRETWIFLAEF